MLKAISPFYSVGLNLRAKKGRSSGAGFVFRVKIGDYEVEVKGTRSEVLETINDLPSLVHNVEKAFDATRPKKFATLTLKTETPKEEKNASEKYPKIPNSESTDEAILNLLETEWGKWRPHTLEELRDALKANGFNYPARTLAAVLIDLGKREKVRRWNTDAGYVYILAEKEAFRMRSDANEQS